MLSTQERAMLKERGVRAFSREASRMVAIFRKANKPVAPAKAQRGKTLKGK